METHGPLIKLDLAEELRSSNPGEKTLPAWPGPLAYLPGSLAGAAMHSLISGLTANDCHLILGHWARDLHLCLQSEQKNRVAVPPVEKLLGQQTPILEFDELGVWSCDYYPAELYVAPARDFAAAIGANGRLR